LSLAGWSAACAGPGAPDTRRALLEGFTSELIVPLYARVAEETLALDQNVDTLCAAPDSAGLDAARAAWWRAREPWKQAEVFAFGPYSRPEYRLGPRMDTWPVSVERIRELLDGSVVLDQTLIAGAAISQRGFPVVEYLLYGDGMLDPSEFGTRRCDYLRAATADLGQNASDIHRAWSPEGDDFSSELAAAGRGGSAFRSLRHAFGEVVNRIVFTLENARRDKLGRPLGEATGSPQPELSESRPSGRSLQDLRDSLDGIERLYFGHAPAGDGLGSFDGLTRYARERGSDFDATIQTQLADARAAIDAVEGPLATAVVSAPERVQAVSDALDALQRTIEVDVIAALGVALSFNDNDGD
jgi:predicted lipoprotein